MATLEEVTITAELSRRPSRAPDSDAEIRAFVALARVMADASQTVLQRLVEAAVELTGAGTAAISLLEEREGKLVLRWHAVAGMYAGHLTAVTPGEFSPCGLTVDRAAPRLLSNPGRHFACLDGAEPRIAECLLLPLCINGRPVGTIWLLAPDEARKFDAEDVRVMSRLGEFCAAALHALHSQYDSPTGLLANKLIEEQPAARRAMEERARVVERRVEEARREGEQRFNLLVQNVPDYALFMLDPAGRVTVWNEGAARLKGYSERKILGQHFSVFFTPEDRARGQPEYERGMAEAYGPYEGEGWRVRKDGSRFWGNEIITALRDRRDGRDGRDGRNGRVGQNGVGNLTGFTKLVRDLTERKKWEDALRQSEARYRTVVEGVRDYAIFSMDTSRRVTHWNHAARSILGYEEREIVGQSGDIIYTPEDLEKRGPELEQRQADAQGRAEDERWHLRKDGSRFWGSGILTAVRDEAGRVTGYFKVLRDRSGRKKLEDEKTALLASERKAREEAEAAREEAEAAARLMDEFLAVTSHELRTPLAAILLWSHLLRGGTLNERARAEAIDIISQSAKAQQGLIEDLLDLSRVAAGKMRLNVKPTRLFAVIGAAIEAVRPMAEAKGISIEAFLDGAVGKVRADADRLQQVAWNLLTNAVKFSDKGDRVAIKLERAGDEVRLVVSDTGRGMSREFLPHVFDRFRQADASTTRQEGGLGLGLSIVKQLAELHGGSVAAQSAGEGKGATSTVRLPLPEVVSARGKKPGSVKRTTGVVEEAFSPSSALTGVWVLLVEDEEYTRRAVAWVLEQSGAEVTAVPSAAEALKALEVAMGGKRPHVLLSDVGMAGADGYELVKRLRAMEAEKGHPPLPAAALTAYARGRDRRRALSAGFQMHIRKPVEPNEVVRAVATLAGRN